ncbi:hypothetical protein ACET3Z_009858 [Daucus carota]
MLTQQNGDPTSSMEHRGRRRVHLGSLSSSSTITGQKIASSLFMFHCVISVSTGNDQPAALENVDPNRPTRTTTDIGSRFGTPNLASKTTNHSSYSTQCAGSAIKHGTWSRTVNQSGAFKLPAQTQGRGEPGAEYWNGFKAKDLLELAVIGWEACSVWQSHNIYMAGKDGEDFYVDIGDSKSGKNVAREDMSSDSKDMLDIGSAMEALTRVDLDLAYSFEKLFKLDDACLGMVKRIGSTDYR